MDNLLSKSIETVKNQVAQKVIEAGVNVKVKPQYPTLLNTTNYPLNKSRTKFVAVGFGCYQPFAPAVVIYGQKNDVAVFNETEWNALMENQGIISSYFSSKDFHPQSLNISNGKRIKFNSVGGKKVIILQDWAGSEVYLGLESITECWELQHLLEYRIQLLKSLEFEKFYSSVIKGIWELPGEFKTNIENVLYNLNIKSDNVAIMLEVLKYGVEIIKCDIELNQFAQAFN